MKQTIVQGILLYLVGINVLTWVVFGIDKWKAQHNCWRISEQTLLLLAGIGGSLGAWLGMKYFHHKTLKRKFAWGVPGFMVLHFLLVAAAVWYFYFR